MKEYVRVFAPATVTNIGCGFDVMGFALDAPGDEIELFRSTEAGIRIRSIHGDGGALPTETRKNTCSLAIQSLADAVGWSGGCDIILHKKMALGTGMGSSAASAAGGVRAFSELIGIDPDKHKLLTHALVGEALTSAGKVHADNVAASLFGGVSLVRSLEPLHIVSLAYPDELAVCVTHPHIELKTSDMRKLLPENIPLSLAVRQWGNIAALVAGFERKDPDLIAASLNDFIVEPLRSPFIPLYNEIRALAAEMNCLGSGISGSGPSLFTLCRSLDQAGEFGEKAGRLYRAAGHDADVFVSPINGRGPVILESH